MKTLLADLDRVADVARQTLDTYSISAEKFHHALHSLDPSQLDSLVRQATTQLREETDRRGWTASPSSPAARTDTALEVPSEVEEVLANASPEQAGAFGRL